MTALSRSSTTLSPALLPDSLISRILASASLSASSSAFLLPLECCAGQPAPPASLDAHLGLELLELGLGLLAVLLDLLLGLAAGVLDALGAVWRSDRAVWLGGCIHSLAGTVSVRRQPCDPPRRTLLHYLLGLALSLCHLSISALRQAAGLPPTSSSVWMPAEFCADWTLSAGVPRASAELVAPSCRWREPCASCFGDGAVVGSSSRPRPPPLLRPSRPHAAWRGLCHACMGLLAVPGCARRARLCKAPVPRRLDQPPPASRRVCPPERDAGRSR